MRILSNEYLPNLPGSEKKLKGGPARFTRDFSAFALLHGHEWIGIAHDATSEQAVVEFEAAPHRRYFAVQGQHASFQNMFGLEEYPEDVAAYFAEDIAEIESVIDRTSPDLLLLNGYSVHAWCMQLAAMNKGLPVVIEHAGLQYREVEAYADLYTEAGRKLACFAEQDGAIRATINIFLNEFSRELFIRDVVGNAPFASTVAPLPHAGWEFPSAYAPKPRDERVIGVVARWDRIKNHEAILEFARAIKQSGKPWKVRSITEIPETPKHAEFKAEYRELVEVVPHMDRDEMRDFYGSIDALIVPSRFDVSPTVVMEGLAFGAPSLISEHVGWVSEYREYHMEHWIADFADPARAVEVLARQFARADWPEVGQFAQYIASAHAPEQVFAQYFSIFENVIR